MTGGDADSSIDPVTLEVLNNRFHQIAREAGATLTQTAASPVTVEAKDLGFNVTTPTGENIVFSVWMPRHGTTLSHMVKSSIEAFGLDDIHEGDMFMTNDPYAGALHVMDIAVLAPVHHDGELIAWTGCATHHLDVGAMTSGWPSRSTDWYQEGVKYPPLKLMEGGEVRDDVFELFLRNVRMPSYQGLDLKAQMAANTVARERIAETTGEYGTDVVGTSFEELIRYGEETARERISELEDGMYRHVDYLDYDDLYRIECTLTVDGEELCFDFGGTDEQAPSFVNAAYACAEANLHNVVQAILFPDETVNAGTFAPMEVQIPEGTIFNCTPPTACCGASIFSGWRVMSLVQGVLSKALVASGQPERATAEWGGGSPNIQLSGRDRDGEQFTLFVMDQCMLGGGARGVKDGLHTANVLGSTNTSIPNVELHERRYPIRYLFRRIRQNSGGVGEYRGGEGGEFALTPHGVDEVTVNPFQHRRDAPPFGLFGGYPGQVGAIDLHVFDEGSSPTRTSIDGRSPDRTFEQRNEEVTLTDGQVIHAQCAGGGAIGDPLDREPSAVEADVREGRISPEVATRRYGVEFDGEGIDDDASSRRRAEMRSARIETAPEGTPTGSTCEECDGAMATVAAEPADKGIQSGDSRIYLEEHICEDCGTLSSVQVTVSDDA